MKGTVLALAALAALTAASIHAAEDPEPEARTAPYFVVQSDDGVDGFPLLKTEATVRIAGVIADVHLTQVYKNSGNKTIEAVYVFPLGTRSAVHGMTMRIADRTITAQIEERQKAKQIYDDAKEEGKVASLLEQERPNVFTMRVANILPGDVVNVTVDYTELLVPERGTYEYVFPTVVGPRFTGESDPAALEGADSWTATPHLHEGEEPPYAFHIDVTLDTGIPIATLDVPSHTVNVQKDGDRATVLLAPEQRKGGNRDFVLRYSLRGDAIQSGLVLYPGEEENFFLLMVEPPASVKPQMIPPREVVFVVDVSGSMHGFPLDTAKTLVERLVKGLRPGDYFNILFFSGGSNVLAEKPLPATPENLAKAIDMLTSQRGGGGTRILDALKRASELERRDGLSRTFIAVTDGYVSVEKETFDLIREGMDGANFFAFGIGSSVNRYLIEGMARAGNGRPFVVLDGTEAEETAQRFTDYVRTPLLTDLSVSREGFDAYDVEPPVLPDLFSERPLVLFGKYRNAEGAITVGGRTPDGAFTRTFAVTPDLESADNAALRHLWARKRLELLSDYAGVGVNNRDDVLALGLAYHLMTPYTSFVAVDTVVRDTGETVTVKQPLPLPEGVSDLAVGGERRGWIGAGLSALRVRGSRKQYFSGAPAPAVTTPVAMEEFDTVERDRAEPSIRVVAGTTPAGLTLEQAEAELTKQLGDKLSAALAEWELTKLVLVLEVERGRVTGVKVSSYKGKKLDEEALAAMLKGLSFGRGITGSVELSLVYR